MYFDTEPKSKLEDFYDFRPELDKLTEILRQPRARCPLIVVTGLRRTGKTSLILTALEESGLPSLVIDGRNFEGSSVITERDLLNVIEQELRKAVRKKKFLDVLEGIEWLKVSSEPPWVQFEWGRKHPNLQELLHSLEVRYKKFVLVIDEAQEFRKLAKPKLQPLMAHIYDYVGGIQMIVTGSQVGLLNDFLQVDDPEAPLFGRGWAEIKLAELSDEAAEDFLVKGFQQAGIGCDPKTIGLALEQLDGIMGWLTYFGFKSVQAGGATEKALRETVRDGSKLSLHEFGHFLRTREQAKRRYERVMKKAAELRKARWSELKKALDLAEKFPTTFSANFCRTWKRRDFWSDRKTGTTLSQIHFWRAHLLESNTIATLLSTVKRIPSTREASWSRSSSNSETDCIHLGLCLL